MFTITSVGCSPSVRRLDAHPQSRVPQSRKARGGRNRNGRQQNHKKNKLKRRAKVSESKKDRDSKRFARDMCIKINLCAFPAWNYRPYTRKSHKFVNGDIEAVIVASKILIKIALPRRYISYIVVLLCSYTSFGWDLVLVTFSGHQKQFVRFDWLQELSNHVSKLLSWWNQHKIEMYKSPKVPMDSWPV